MIIDCWKSLAGMSYPNFICILYARFNWLWMVQVTIAEHRNLKRGPAFAGQIHLQSGRGGELARLPTLRVFTTLMFGKACGQLLSMLEPPPQDMQEYMDSTESTGPDGGELSWVDKNSTTWVTVKKWSLQMASKSSKHQSSRHHRCLGSRD